MSCFEGVLAAAWARVQSSLMTDVDRWTDLSDNGKFYSPVKKIV